MADRGPPNPPSPPSDDLLLKVTPPPRVPRHLVMRPRLQIADERLRDHPVLLGRRRRAQQDLRCWRSGDANTWRWAAWWPGCRRRHRDDVMRLVRGWRWRCAPGPVDPLSATRCWSCAATGLEGVTAWRWPRWRSRRWRSCSSSTRWTACPSAREALATCCAMRRRTTVRWSRRGTDAGSMSTTSSGYGIAASLGPARAALPAGRDAGTGARAIRQPRRRRYRSAAARAGRRLAAGAAAGAVGDVGCTRPAGRDRQHRRAGRVDARALRRAAAGQPWHPTTSIS